MKQVAIALMLCALPATAFAQDLACRACDHVAPYFRGTGGFIGTVAQGVEEVTFVASCGSATTSGEAAVNGNTASQLFTRGNGLACDQAGGTLEIAGLEDGGWYWINDTRNSAVGNLVPADVLNNETTEITDPGDSVSIAAGRGAVFLKHTPSGRVGILPNILPEPPTAAPTKCGFKGSATAASPASPVQTGCMLGDGKTTVLATSTNGITGATVRIMDKGSVTRPGGTGMVTIVADLWGNGSGHYVTTHDAGTANGISALRGHAAAAATDAGRAAARYTGVSYGLSLRTGGPGAGSEITSGTPVGGVDFTEASNAATITIASDDAYCDDDNNHSATVNVTATMSSATDADQVVPSIARNATSGAVGSMSFTVACPSASANQGQNS